MKWLAVGLAAAALLARGQAQDRSPAPPGNAEAGKTAYVKNGCYECHGYEGQGAPWLGGPRIGPDPMPFPRFLAYVRAPTGDMPAYAAKALPDAQLADIHAYLRARPRPPAVNTIPLLSSQAAPRRP